MGKMTINKEVRVFKNFIDQRLSRTELSLRAGDVIEAEPPVIMLYDHRDQVVIPFLRDGERHFILQGEL